MQFIFRQVRDLASWRCCPNDKPFLNHGHVWMNNLIAAKGRQLANTVISIGMFLAAKGRLALPFV